MDGREAEKLFSVTYTRVAVGGRALEAMLDSY